MNSFIFIVAGLLCVLPVGQADQILDDSSMLNNLRYYERIHKDELTSQILLSGGQHDPTKIVIHLNTHSKKFSLYITSHPNIWSADFKAFVENSTGIRTPLQVNPGHFYKGRVLNHPGSSVVAYLPDDGILTATLRFKEEGSYHIERSHLYIKQSHDFHMISYHESDVKVASGSFQLDYQKPFDVAYTVRDRLRRQTVGSSDMVCGMTLVADHKYFRDYARNPSLAAALMVRTLLDADDIYSSTIFRSGSQTFSNLGLQVDNVIVHTEPTMNDDSHYNRIEAFGSDELLDAFSYEDWSTTCLAHLFTYTSFSDSRLGLAYIAEPNNPGGICSQTRSRRTNGRMISFNTGFTSTRAPSGRLIGQLEELHSFAHEVGHNWGAQHDPGNNIGCASGGPYLMYPSSLDGTETSHNQFSDCSKSSIGAVLETNMGCFKVRESDGFCGDHLVQTRREEQCDSGAKGDVCCTSNCRFQDGTQCSDANEECCHNCSYASGSTVCRSITGFALPCKEPTMCNGLNSTCPDNFPVSPNLTQCIGGVCLNGNCISQCELEDLKDCKCEDGVNACRVCCSSGGNSTCQAQTPTTNRSDGYQCIFQTNPIVTGTCDMGICRLISDQIIPGGSRSGATVTASLGEFIASNIVGTIAFFTFIIFLIPSCALHLLVDRRYYSKIKQKIELNNKKILTGKKRRTFLKRRRNKSRSKSPVPPSRGHLQTDSATADFRRLLDNSSESSEEHLLAYDGSRMQATQL